MTSLLGSILLADGMSFLIDPDGQLRMWAGPKAPRFYRRMISFFGRHMGLARLVAAVEVGVAAGLLRKSGRALLAA